MAENTESPKLKPETWVIAALAAAGLLCVSLVAVALVLILRQQSAPAPAPVTASPVINIQTGPAAPQGILRPAEPAKPQANRGSAQDPMHNALPLKLNTQGSVARADQQAEGEAARASLPSPDAKVFLRVRGQAPAPTQAQAPLPMPVRYRADPQGVVPGVFASRSPSNAPVVPDRPFADTGTSSPVFDLQLSAPRSTQLMGGFRAPEGFSFFTGKLKIRNRSDKNAPLDLGALELRDQENTVYLANPELSGTLPVELVPGAEAEAELCFLASDQGTLSALALAGDGAPVLLPLARR